MEMTVVVGNGCDLSNGLKTSYHDFFENKILTNNSQNKLYEEFKTDYNNNSWFDMELAIGEHSSIYESEYDKFLTDKEELQNDLLDYLEKEQSKVLIESVENKKKNLQYFIEHVDEHISAKDRETVFKKHIKYWEQAHYDSYDKNWDLTINFISFNYTDLLEKKLFTKLDWGFDLENIFRSRLFRNASVKRPNEICHVHGTLNDSMIFGVDNIDQIKQPNDKINSYMIKKELQKSSSNLFYEQGLENIATSDLIVVIGATLGKTDNYWVEMIIANLARNDHSLLIFNVFSKNNDRFNRNSIWEKDNCNRLIYKKFEKAIDANLKLQTILSEEGKTKKYTR